MRALSVSRGANSKESKVKSVVVTRFLEYASLCYCVLSSNGLLTQKSL